MLAIESDTEDARTQAGQVLGTFSYMAPEQACGKVHELDERCDVFGLGGILCTILTGRPPYHGTDARRVWRQAAEADLADAWSRLDQCGADGELIALAKRCLAKDKPDRPRHAGEVAQAIAGYLASVQQRLEQARLAQAKAEVQAREERKRRRLVAVLGLVVLLLIGGATAASLWYVRDQGRKEAAAAARRTYLDREVAAALDEAERLRRQLHQQLQDQRQAPRLLSDLDQWRELLEAAHAAWRRGDRIAAGDREMLSPALRQRLETLAAQLQADDKDRELAVVLDRTRLESFDPNQGEIMLWKAAPKLSAALIDGGYNLEKDDLEHVAARISQSPIRLPLVAAIDFYATVTRDMSVRRRLMETASRADPDPWRDRLRQPSTWKDKQVLTALANEVDLAAQTPQALAALSLRLRQAGGDAALLLQRALVFHPRDFSLFFELGHASTDPQEQMGAFRAAASIRPDSPYPYYALGVVYYTTAKLDQAEACYRKALQLDDKYASAHGNLGLVLADRGQLDQAIACYERAIELDPHSPSLYSNLGGAYKDLGQPARAVAACRRAIELDPDFVPAYINLAIALRVQEALGEAEQCLRHATTMAPHNPWAWGNLGHVLTQQGRFQEGLQALQRAHELGLKDPRWPADRSSEWIQESQERIAANEKLPAVLRGEISLESPRELLAFSRLCLFHKKMFAAAARFYAAAEAADPQLQETQSGDRYNSACAAVLASSGQGVDANQLSDDQGRELRQQALVWLRVELAAWLKIVDSAPAKGPELAKVLRHWQRDPDLSGIRDETALARLAADEQQAFRALWAEVAARRKRWEAMAPSIE
jgi:serine/threonine-protein kinase